MEIEASKINILLCSPKEGVGGIARWTNHILDFYDKNETKVNLKQFYPKVFGVYQNTPIITRIFRGIRSYLPFIFYFFKELSKNNYDLVHLVSSASISLFRDVCLLIICKIKNVKVITHFRFGRIPIIFKDKNWEYNLIKLIIKLSDRVIVIDESSFRILLKEGYTNVELLPNPLTPKVEEIIKKYKTEVRKDRQILFAGHHLETKGVYELINACRNIKNIKLKMIGHVSDEMKSSLINLAGSECDDWLEIVGELDYEWTIKEMLSCHIFVLPTYTEGFPNVIIESMACGCAIVTTPVGAIPEMLQMENEDNFGLFVPIKDSLKLELAIKRFLDDSKLTLRCGSNAKIRVNQEYSMAKVWKEMARIWDETLDRK